MPVGKDHEVPVRLVEDDTGHRFLIYGTERGVQVELRYEGDALWMTQAQMAGLFGRDPSVIYRHIANILEEGELSEEEQFAIYASNWGSFDETCRPLQPRYGDFGRLQGQFGPSHPFSKMGDEPFLVRFATSGFVVDAERLKNPDEQDRVRELREVVRDIRASEVKRLCGTSEGSARLCQDYEPGSATLD
jgi:hypothetical protein